MIHQSRLLVAVMGKLMNLTEADSPGASIPDNIATIGLINSPSLPL